MKRQWETEELVEHWTLHTGDLALLSKKTGATRLGFAVLLKFFQREGRFPSSKTEIPGVVITFVAAQVGVAREAYLQYDWQGRTIKEHRAQIREALGFRESTVAAGERMQGWLLEHGLPREHQEEHLREQACQWHRREHLEAPTPDRMFRLIRSAAHTFEQQLCETTYARLPEEALVALEALLAAETGESEPKEEITLQHLRQDLGHVGLATMLQELAKFQGSYVEVSA